MPMSRQIVAEFDPSCHDFLLIKVRTSASSALGYVLGIIFPGSIYSNSAAFLPKDATFTIKHLTPRTPGHTLRGRGQPGWCHH